MTLVLTGGPSAGKTTVLNVLVRSFGRRVTAVPESATLLFSGGFRRAKTSEGVAAQQRAIFQIQSAQELIYAQESKDQLMICDRGTVDGKAYWPASEGDFFMRNNTTEAAELSRYKWVLHLDSATSANYNHSNNPFRKEDASEAIEVNQLVKSAWANHPQRLIISPAVSFSKKVIDCIQIVEMILGNCSWKDIVTSIRP